MRGGAGRLPPQAAPKQPALSGSRYKPPPLVEVLTYGDWSATHLDLVQEPTDPVWNSLDPNERSTLLERDLPFLLWLLERLPHLESVICAGKTVSERLCTHVPVGVRKTGTMKRIRWWVGTAHLERGDLPIGGWNYPLNQPTGLGTEGEKELGKVFKDVLL